MRSELLCPAGCGKPVPAMCSVRRGVGWVHARPGLHPVRTPPTHLPPALQHRQKRSLTIRDDSGRSVELTLWGKYANEPGDHLFSVRRGASLGLGAMRAG